ncbi:MAG: AAA family ATPase [Candidatus Handelsmanbacteria bacterium]|nr:AAA family ATPase [Candidatus Handelsmanbacteria bacterium]
MLLEYFGFRLLPFSKEITAAHLFPAAQHQELLARLQYAVRHRAFALLTGDPGAGKSVAIRALYELLDRTRHHFVYIADSRLTPTAFYRDVLTQLGVTAPYHFLSRETRRLFEQTILDGYRLHGQQPVIVLDEAHLLPGPMLQEVRFLLNFHLDSACPMTFVLVGQSELRGLLRLRTFEAIAQRVQVRFHLGPLTEPESIAYILHHLRLAGADRPLFSEQALQKIAAESRGFPRLINSLCTSCLLDACARDQRLIDEANVDRVLLELQDLQAAKGGSPW